MKAKPEKLTNFPRLTDHVEYAGATQKLEEVVGRITTLEGKIRSGEAQREMAAKALGQRTKRAELILEGKDPDALGADVPTMEAIQAQRTELLDLKAAESIQRRRVAELRESASRAICEGLRPHYQRLMADFAESLVGTMERAEAVFDLRNELQGSGVLYSDSLRQVNLNPFLASDPHSRQNLLISEIERELGVSIARPVLAEAERRRSATLEEQNKRDGEAARADEEERKQKHAAAVRRAGELRDLGSLGLIGRQERVERIGGFMRIDRRPEGGTRIRASVPLDSADRRA